MRKNTYLAICFVIGIFYILFVLLNTKASLFAGDICNGQLCNDIFEYIRIASVSFIVMLPILITGPFYRFFKKSVFIYFCFLIFIFIFGDLHTSGFNFNIEYMVEVLAICFSLFLFVSLALVHLYMITKNGFMKYIK